MATLAAIACGLASREFPAALPAALGKYPGDALWALMVFFLLCALLPRGPGLRIGAAALAFSYAIELLKLCQASWLLHFRYTTVGHLIFGHVFMWPNLIAYALGVLLGIVLDRLLLFLGL